MIMWRNNILNDNDRRVQVKRRFKLEDFLIMWRNNILNDMDRRVQAKTTFKTEGFSDDNEGQDTL